MNRESIRPVVAAAVVAALCFATAPRPAAAHKTTPFERLVAKALDPSDTSVYPANIDIVIERWSTDEESDSLRDTLLQAGADTLDTMIGTLQTIQHSHRRVGIMELPGWQGFGPLRASRRSRIVQFARNIMTPSGRQVIVGIRPENFEDASIVQPDMRSHGITFNATIEDVESMGSDVFVYFTQDGGLSATTDQLADLAQDSGKGDIVAGDETVTARLDPVTHIKEGDEAELWADIRTMHIFDPDTGANLSLSTEPAEAPGPAAT